MGYWFPEPCAGDDLTVRETLVKVWNEILHRLQLEHDKLTGQDLEVIGFGLRRCWELVQAYKADKSVKSLTEWVELVVRVAKEAGVPVPV